MHKIAEFADLLGKTLDSIDGLREGSESVGFVTTDGRNYIMHHLQDCCESVSIEDVCGNVADLIGTPITMAYEESSNQNPEGVVKECQGSFTWTFYRIGTNKGTVVIRWYGESNGYYSEAPYFYEVEHEGA